MSFFGTALIFLLNNNKYNLYTFDDPRDLEVFRIMNRRCILVPYDEENNVIVYTEEIFMYLVLNQHFHNRIYL
jgi:hypothetical protein